MRLIRFILSDSFCVEKVRIDIEIVVGISVYNSKISEINLNE